MTSLFLLGAVLWSGQYSGSRPGDNLPDGLTYLASQGIQSVKVPIDPSNLPTEFGITVSAPTDTSYLPNAMANPAVVAGLGTPGIKNFVLSTYDAIVDGLNGSQRNFTNLAFLQSRESDIISTYEGMALALFRNYKGTGKTFIIGTWEADNSLYCGSAYDFEIDPTFRSTCLSGYQSTYGAATPEAAFTAMHTWFHLREQGILQARAQAAAEGDTGVTVLGGIEFVAVHMINDMINPLTGAPYPTALYTLIPALFQSGDLDAVTYSAYESLGGGTLLQDFPIIEQQVSGHPVSISEFGFYEGQVFTVGGVTYTADQAMTNTVRQIVSLGNQGRIQFATAWQAFQDGSAQEFGMYTNSGTATDLMTSAEAGLTPPANTPAPSIAAAAYGGYYGSDTYVTVYGSNFAGTGDVITLNCGSGPIPNANSYDSTGQINIDFPSTGSARVCSAQVTTNGQLSNVVTGIQVTAAPPPPSISQAVYDGPYVTNAYITAYGANFAGTGDVVTLNCGSGPIASTISYDSTGQINIQFPSVSTARTCSVQVTTVGQSSNVITGINVPATPPPVISGVGYDGVYAGSAYISAYGSGFSGSGDTAVVNCGSGAIPSSLSYDSTGQINIEFAPVSYSRTCTVQITTSYWLTSGVSAPFTVPAGS